VKNFEKWIKNWEDNKDNEKKKVVEYQPEYEQIKVIKEKIKIMQKYFRIAVICEIQYSLFTVETWNRVWVYNVLADYAPIRTFKIDYNIIVPVKPNYFMTAGIIGDSVKLYDSNVNSKPHIIALKSDKVHTKAKALPTNNVISWKIQPYLHIS